MPASDHESGHDAIAALANALIFGELLAEVQRRWGTYDFVDHWQQGEFHHDTVLRIPSARHSAAGGKLPGQYIVVATNCNGGVKEVLCFDELPTRGGLWRTRCPENDEFQGELPTVLARATTEHWLEPCVLLAADARSEYRRECRVRQAGGGWMQKK